MFYNQGWSTIFHQKRKYAPLFYLMCENKLVHDMSIIVRYCWWNIKQTSTSSGSYKKMVCKGQKGIYLWVQFSDGQFTGGGSIHRRYIRVNIWCTFWLTERFIFLIGTTKGCTIYICYDQGIHNMINQKDR